MMSQANLIVKLPGIKLSLLMLLLVSCFYSKVVMAGGTDAGSSACSNRTDPEAGDRVIRRSRADSAHSNLAVKSMDTSGAHTPVSHGDKTAKKDNHRKRVTFSSPTHRRGHTWNNKQILINPVNSLFSMDSLCFATILDQQLESLFFYDELTKLTGFMHLIPNPTTNTGLSHLFIEASGFGFMELYSTSVSQARYMAEHQIPYSDQLGSLVYNNGMLMPAPYHYVKPVTLKPPFEVTNLQGAGLVIHHKQGHNGYNPIVDLLQTNGSPRFQATHAMRGVIACELDFINQTDIDHLCEVFTAGSPMLSGITMDKMVYHPVNEVRVLPENELRQGLLNLRANTEDGFDL